MKEEKQSTFEEAYERLEIILAKMNQEQVSLDTALALYEEADTLIASCQKRLNEAEQKIEVLLKKRDGGLVMDEKQVPQTQPFVTQNQSTLNEIHG